MSHSYVGITGFVSRAEVDACFDALPDGLTLMCGVLVSAKTLRGERNKWWRRYPRVEDVAAIFSPDPRCLNLIHYCDDVAPDTETVERLLSLGGEHLHGFQFNGAWPLRKTIAPLAHRHHVVLQVRDAGADPVAFFRAAVDDIAVMFTDSRCHILLDASGGRGAAISVEAVRETVKALRWNLGYYFGIGVAGGLCAETVPALRPLRGYEVSIDAEGRLRDGDEGGTLNLDKARAYLKAAGEVML